MQHLPAHQSVVDYRAAAGGGRELAKRPYAKTVASLKFHPPPPGGHIWIEAIKE